MQPGLITGIVGGKWHAPPNRDMEECKVIDPCSCQPQASSEFPFCPVCRGSTGPTYRGQSQTVIGGPGLQAGGDIDVSGTIVGGDYYSPDNFGYREMEMSRTTASKAWLPDNWLATAAAAAGVLGLLLNLNFNHATWGIWLTLALLLPVVGGVMAVLIRGGIAQSGAVHMFGSIFEQGPDGEIYRSTPGGVCPQCHRSMVLQRAKTDEGTVSVWVCASGVRKHNLGFDPTEFSKVSWR
jgi:hypothetical protein